MSIRVTGVFITLALLTAQAWAADIILNEYNAVDNNEFLGGGNSSVDENGGRASDSYFGRVPGNGGDWFELVVIKDHLDIRGWSLDLYEDGILDETLNLTVHPIWQDLRAGTIITVSEDVPSDVSYDPNAGDWWINVQANNNGDGLYIEKSSFPVSSSNWQLRIRNLAGQVVFGPAGEGVSPASGISGTEIFRLEDNPSATVTAGSTDYDDGDDFSTFGSPNRWGAQSFSKLRPTLTAGAATVTVVTPNGADILAAGDLVDITWTSENVSETALIEFSIDNGYSWTEVYPPNVGNAGTYTWLVPFVVSDEVLVRVSSTTRPGVFDVSDLPFEIVSGL
ncbi:MAG TPA: hypothetical protein PKH24_14775 [Sedimentisphaerales bacterium]|jgi:hypothetical protein|nr:hypothetical protein [Sedimentisphaerales bacterium]HNU31643.1 hypothetical protein [Sedimentisphaerales bacterium]